MNVVHKVWPRDEAAGDTVPAALFDVAWEPPAPGRRRVLGSWKDYLANPAAGNKLIKEANPKQEDDQIAYSLARFKAIKCITGGDAATQGIGIMTEARWLKTRDFMVSTKMIKSDAPWKSAFTTQFVKGLNIIG